MNPKLALSLIVIAASAALCCSSRAQLPDDSLIPPSRPVPTGEAPHMQAKLVKNSADEQVYAVIFYRGDEALSGLTDFAIKHKIEDAHFTGIGAINGATLAWLDPTKQIYHRIPVSEQAEVLSLVGDVSSVNGKPFVHMHAVLGKSNGTPIGGHVFELDVNPTLEILMTVNTVPLRRRPDPESGMKVIDPAQ